MADNKETEASKEEVVTSLNNHDVNNHDVNNHCAIELKEDQGNHTESNDAIKEPVEENNHVAAVVIPSVCEDAKIAVSSDALMAKNSCDDVAGIPVIDPDEKPDAASASHDISDSQKDSSYSQDDNASQDDSGVRVDIESDLSDIKDVTPSSRSNQRTSSRVSDIDSQMADIDKTADKLDSACSMIPIPDSSSDQNQHSDCSSSSRSSKDVFMDAQEDFSNDLCKNMGAVDVRMGKKDDSGIDLEKTPDKSSSGAKSTESANSTEVPGAVGGASSDKESVNNLTDQLEEFYASLPPGATEKEKPSVAETFAADFDTSSDAGNSASYDVTRPVPSDSDSDDMRRRRRRRLSTSSSSSTEGPDEEGNDDDKKKSSDEEEEDMETENDRIPSGKWHPILETRKREMGFSNTVPLSYMFARKTNCSLSLVQRLKLQYKLEYHDGCVNALHFNKSGTLLASGSDDMNIVLWRWDLNKPYIVFESGHRSNVFQAKFMPYSGDTHIVSCAREGMVRLAELSSTGICKGTKKLAQHKGAAHKLAIQQDASHLFYSCGEDAVTFEVDLRQDKPNKLCVTKQNDKKVALYSIHANPFKSFEFVVGGRDHYVRVYDKRMLEQNEGNPVKKFCPHHLVDSDIKANVTCAVYNYNGTEILGTYNDEDIYLFDNDHSDGADFVKRYKGHRNNATVKGVNFYGPHSEYIITGSDCGNIFLWDKETEKVVQYFHGDEGGVINVLEPHPHFPILATSGLDHDVKIWAPTSREPTDLDGLKDVMKRNRKERREERIHMEPDMMDGQMLWLLMQHLRRTSRRNARREGEEVSSSSSNSDNDDDDSDNSGDDGNEPPVSCVQS